jgi:hypothetical protein
MNLTGQKFVIMGIGRFNFLNDFIETATQTPHICYLNFSVTTANTTDKIVTTQKRTAILLSWYPSF